MYAKSAHIYGFKCFGKAVLELRYPGENTDLQNGLSNVNLILGNNGGGKSSVLRAIAIAILAPALLESGFVPYRLVRRPVTGECFLKVVAELAKNSGILENDIREPIELIARIEERQKSRGSLDRLHLDSTPNSPLENLIHDDFTHAFFVVGYGAMRRVETGDFSPSSSRKMRGSRYLRVASLFEDQVALQPIESWLESTPVKVRKEAIKLIDMATPPEISFSGKFSKSEDQYMFEFEGNETPFGSLSDGYRAFVAFVSDMIYRLSEVVPNHLKMRDIPGIVLVDEVDLHLHPSWQQRVVRDLAMAFPNLQFIFSSHSPLIVNSLDNRNIFMTEEADDGSSTVKQLNEKVYGRTVDQLLLSSYFGLETTRPISSQIESENALKKAMSGDNDAALDFISKIRRQSAPEMASVVRDKSGKISSTAKPNISKSSKSGAKKPGLDEA